MRSDADSGALEGFLALALLALTSLALVLVLVVGILVAHERARGAADLAALAAASTLDCAAAGQVAARNGAELDACRLDDGSARVSVVLQWRVSPLLQRAGAPTRFRASAEARVAWQPASQST